MFNQITIVGNLTQDITLRSAQTGNTFATGCVATNHKFKSKSGEEKVETTFLNFIVGGKMAEIANQYLKKGSKVFIIGRLTQNNYTDKDGKNHSSLQVVVEDIRFLDAKFSTGANENTQVQQTPQPPADVQNANVENVGEKLPF